MKPIRYYPSPGRILGWWLAEAARAVGLYVALIWLCVVYGWWRDGGSAIAVFLVGTLTSLIFSRSPHVAAYPPSSSCFAYG